MPNVDNLTLFGMASMPSMDADGHGLLLVVVSARYRLPTPGIAHTAPPELTDAQPAPTFEDRWLGEPGESSLIAVGQSAFTRPGTDIYLTGRAWVHAGVPSIAVQVSLRVGEVERRAIVVGDRRWERRGGMLVASAPVPFDSMPLVYERAFGGVAQEGGRVVEAELRNPVGVGVYADARASLGRRLPNIEDPTMRIATHTDRPSPVGFQPLPRHWLPRRAFAGTFDARWTRTRAPLWPEDFDPRFFSASSQGLWSARRLEGGERVRLEGVCADGSYDFPLPRLRVMLKSRVGRRLVRQALALDAVHFEPEAVHFTMTYRAAVRLPGGIASHRGSVVRELLEWERPRDMEAA